MSDLFDRADLSPMLIADEAPAFDSDDYIYELKLDGVRGLAFLSDITQLRNKRSLLVSPTYPELKQIHKQVKRRCILDGELIVMVGGKPNFPAIQRRALMSNQTRIALAAHEAPVSFIAYDILYYDGADLTGKSLMKRKAILQGAVVENERLSVSRYIEREGKALYALTEQQGLEGIVAKKKTSLYYPGRKTKDWIKSKNLHDDDYVVCGYIEKGRGMTSIVLGQYDKGQLVYQGHVTMGVSGRDFKTIVQHPRITAPAFAPPKGNETAIWLRPELVCTVQFMERTKKGGMRQPVFRGLRDDKAAYDCVVPKK